jgi:hypothetical protein
MPFLSENPMWEAFGTRALFQATYGGADFGECQQAIERVGDGGVDDWHREWTASADRLVEGADESAAAGHRVSARDAYLRASTYYRAAYELLFGAPVDERLRAGFDSESEAVAKAAPLYGVPVELVEIPFEDEVTLSGVFVQAGEAAPGDRLSSTQTATTPTSTRCSFVTSPLPSSAATTSSCSTVRGRGDA